MKNDSPLAIILRRKWIVIGVFLAFVVTAAVVSKTLTKVYVASSTLLVAVPSDQASFDSVQASQNIARSYGDIFDSPNLANLVSGRIPDRPGRSEVLDSTTFVPVEQTQLLRVTVENPSAARAQQIANAWADTVVSYAQQRLQPSTQARLSIADRAPLP
ncbi:MAG: hypothetical protein QOJ07_1388, partial [Thermoleophilaceae bacterium]|nr:hypothetical protein [Thermoleophilaceae bacterium]